jgi:hypothetical protein
MTPLDTLVGLVLSELDEQQEQAVEEHLMSCSECAGTVEELALLGDAVRELVARGETRGFVTPELIAQLRESKLITRTYSLALGATVPCSVSADDRYVLTVLEAPLEGVERVDLLLGERRYVDIPFDRREQKVAWITHAEEIRALPTKQIPLRLFAVTADGAEAALGDYVLDHRA